MPAYNKVDNLLPPLLLQIKQDMKANADLKDELRPPQMHGHVLGVALGQHFANKGELAIAGVHIKISHGIDWQCAPAIHYLPTSALFSLPFLSAHAGSRTAIC